MTLKFNGFKAKRNFHTILNFVLFPKYEMYENKYRTKICDFTVAESSYSGYYYNTWYEYEGKSLSQSSTVSNRSQGGQMIEKRGPKCIFQSAHTSQKMEPDHFKLFAEVWKRQKLMDNSRIVEKISVTSLFCAKNWSLQKPMHLKWLLWQHPAQYLCGKMIFYWKYVKNKSPRRWALIGLRFKIYIWFCAWGGGGGERVNFLFICCMATRLRRELCIELFFTVIKSFWGVHVRVFAEIFAQKWAVCLSKRLVTKAIGMQRQPGSTWTFLTKMNPLDGSGLISDDDSSAISLPSDAGLEISGTWGRERSEIERWEVLEDEGDGGDD